MERFKGTLIILFVFVCTCACLRDNTDYVADVNPRGWYPGENVRIEVPVIDTLKAKDLYIVLRYNTSMLFDSIVLGIAVQSPDTISYEEQFTIFPVRTSDTEYVIGLFPYRSNCVFSLKGVHMFTLSNMGLEQLCGISAIGIKVTDQNDNSIYKE